MAVDLLFHPREPAMEDRDLIESFDRTWGSFPERAMLVHK
jgi:hypothetical protein